jgi:hypothetical protein
LSAGEGITGTTTTTLLIEQARLDDAGQYTLFATNAAGSLTTPAVTLRVFAEPRIEQEPQSLDRPGDSSAPLAVAGMGAEPLAFQWRKDGMALVDGERVSGARQPVLDLSDLRGGDADAYTVVVSNAYGAVTGRVAQVTVGQAEGRGENWCGELDLPPGLSDVLMLAAGDLHALALRRDGTVVAWGDNLHGQCDVPAQLGDVVAVAAGGSHSLVLRCGCAMRAGAPCPGRSGPICQPG